MELSPTGGMTLAVVAAYGVLALAERVAARRPWPPSTDAPWRGRWVVNGAYLLAGQLVAVAARLILLAPAFAWTARHGAGGAGGAGWRAFVDAPAWLETALSLVALDAILYWWHRLNHRVPFLWRWHAAHHRETTMDVSTAVRFHPVELALSALWRAPVVVALGLTPLELGAFDAAVAVAAAFHHANLRLPAAWERAAGRVLVTPGVHEIHHAVEPALRDRNFGVFTTLWDRLFRSFAAGPADPLRRLGI